MDSDNTTSISTVDQDVIGSHILTRLDGWSLATIACVSSQLNSIVAANDTSLWTNICHSTWPSTNTPRLQKLIHDDPRSFFSNSSSTPDSTSTVNHYPDENLPSELISAVDVYYRGQVMLSKVVETETVSGWYSCSPFRVNLIDTKDKIPTRILYPDTEEACRELAENMTLSWILIDPTGGRVVNLSSQKPVSVQRHWLTGEVNVCFASVMGLEQQEQEQCCVLVSFGGTRGMEMHVREVSLQVEDLDGMHLNGKDSLVILQRALEGKKENLRGREEGVVKRRYEDYLETRRVRKEKKLKREGTLDLLCVVVGVFSFTSLLLFAFWR